MSDPQDHASFYCHWDSHDHNVLFANENELGSHLKSHIDSVPNNQIACHWDACHELINLDEYLDHFKTEHYKDSFVPHENCPNPHYLEPSLGYARVHAQAIAEPVLDLSAAPVLPTVSEQPACCEPAQCMWVHDGEVCGKWFPNSHELNAHLAEDHVGRGHHTYVCNWKGCKRDCRPFTQRQKMIRHLQTHARNWAHRCLICGRNFNDNMALQQHKRIHSGEKPHQCSVCGKKFTATSSLTVHMRTHTGEKPLVCKFPGCGKRFSESSNLSKHMKTHMEKTLECHICGRKFCRRDQLQRHISLSHNISPSPQPVQIPFQGLHPVQGA